MYRCRGFAKQVAFVAVSITLLGIMEVGTRPEAHGTRLSTMGFRRALGRPTAGCCIPVGVTTLTMDVAPILFQDPAESEAMTGNGDLYDHVHTWYLHRVYARGTPGLNDLRQAGLGAACKTITADGADHRAWWFTAAGILADAELPHCLCN